MIIENFFEDHHIFSVGREPLRSYYIPSSPETVGEWNEREESDRFFLLNGTWKFRFFESVYDCREPFFKEDDPNSDFGEIPVPSNWQDHGYDRHQYTNLRYPFPFDPPYVPYENPCGAYVRNFHYSKPAGTQRHYLIFEGVDSCFYLWLNGSFVGYNQVSHNFAEFDVTDSVREGVNKLAVLVLKWCDGSYLEDQDKFRSSGIFRDVYILARPGEHIRDYFVHSSLSGDCREADISIDLFFSGAEIPVRGRLYDPFGTPVAEAESVRIEEGGGDRDGASADRNRRSRLQMHIEKARTWNAETPELYTLILETKGESIRERVGFRKIEIRDAVLYLNGKKIRFRGMNRHDSDPYVGSAVTREHIMRDLMLMKRHNVNAIRCSHYPNAPEFYELCDRLGFYVICEADLEIHGVEDLFGVRKPEGDGGFPFPAVICDNPEWIPAITDRVRRALLQQKNRPCILVWSMGNESGYGCGFEEALKWARSYDRERPLVYEGFYHRPRPIRGQYDASYLDFHCRMYASIPEMRTLLDNHPDKPFLLCEYSHAMGNGPGDLEDYFELEDEYESFAGGFVWEWCDHAVYAGKTDDGREKFDYGGDFGEYPHDGNFCLDGMVTPDRRISEGLSEYKNVQRPLRIQCVDKKESIYALHNRMDFTNLKDLAYLSYHLLSDGEHVAAGEIRDEEILDVAPRGKKTVRLPIVIPDKVDGALSVLIHARRLKDSEWAKAGFSMGFDQVMINDCLCQKAQELLSWECGGKTVEYERDEEHIRIIGEDFSYIFDCRRGMMESMSHKGYEYFEKPMEMNIWRAPTDNDRVVKRLWYEAGYDRTTTRAYQTDVRKIGDGSVEIESSSSLSAVYRQRYLDIRAKWVINPAGVIIVAMEIERDALMRCERWSEYFASRERRKDVKGIEDCFYANEAYLPRLGVRMFLPREMAEAEYFGYGPMESYIDKHRASYIGKFHSSVSSMHVDYIRPQENGSHYRADYVSVTDGCHTLTAYNDRPISFNLSEYMAEELERTAHNYELEKSGYTVFCLDYAQSGIGSGSCGPQLADKYRLNADEYSFSFRLIPDKR